MTMTNPSKSPETSLAKDWLYAARYYLSGRRGLIAGAAILIAIGLAFNWNWLVATGVAPLLISILPCAAMCALGLCMHKGNGHGKSTARPGDHDGP